MTHDTNGWTSDGHDPLAAAFASFLAFLFAFLAARSSAVSSRSAPSSTFIFFFF